MTVMIAGGGTGGHLFPGIALAQELRRRDPKGRIVFVGTARGIETRAVPKAGFELELLPISGLRRTGIAGALLSLARMPWALVRAVQLVRRLSPAVAVSVGGYAAGPAVLAARLCGVPCAVMEQNAIPGFTNRLLGKLARRVFAALPTEGFAAGKVVVLGNPVRTDLLSVRDAPYAPRSPRRLLVFGGSQGARALNEAMLGLLPRLADGSLRLDVTHQTGQMDYDRVRAAYEAAGVKARVTPFIDDMAGAYRDADVVLSRSGATTLAELTVCGRPALLVPYPFAVDDHQTKNARTVAERGAAVLLPQPELTAERLAHELSALSGDEQRLVAMAAAARAAGHPEAAAQIASSLEEIASV
jgi:UDP-N-acetylglucosamine--N-acetylmuramyl-(pentapeptide) pyrophosphoryl-undecaprenol N-acetylglucosamine transferase